MKLTMFQGIPIAYFICVEACAGHAGLTAKLALFGLDAMGIDHKRNEQKPIGPVAVLEFDTAEGRSEFLRIIGHDLMFYLHWAPPCGTSSRAREKPLPSYLRKEGAPEPRPAKSTVSAGHP